MKKQETIADIVAQIRAAAYIQNADSPQSVLNLADRIEAAEQREVEEWNALNNKVADFENTRALKIHYFDELERYKKAVKPLLDYDFGDYVTPWKTLRVKGEIIDGAAETADGFPFSLAANDSCCFGYDEFIKMANLIGSLQAELKEKRTDDEDEV